MKMKTISHQLKQAFNALAFANAGNLHALNTMLNTPERSAPPAERRNTAPKRNLSVIVAPHSPSF
jgi:hypothetical protein